MFRQLRILSYHNIDDAPAGVAMPGLYVPPAEFARQMWSLRRLGLRGVTLTEGVERLARNDVRDVVAITFDDGYRDNLRYALPVLQEYGFAATCYVVSDRIGAYNDWDASILGARKDLMTSRELDSWLWAGMEIGSHTRTHARLDGLGEAAVFEELAGSREQLMKITGVPAAHFCYPYGSCGDATPDLVRRAGYATATTTRVGFAKRGGDSYLLPRVSLGARAGMTKLAAKLLVPR